MFHPVHDHSTFAKQHVDDLRRDFDRSRRRGPAGEPRTHYRVGAFAHTLVDVTKAVATRSATALTARHLRSRNA